MANFILIWWIIRLIGPSTTEFEYRAPLRIVAPPSTEPAALFNSPVHRQIALSGTFGELRPNHFHAGLDIKSQNGSTGEPVYAASKGYISRIKISAYGYGRALYIQHQNGHSSVYAHLDHFIPAIENYIKKEHYKRQRFEMDFSLNATTFPVEEDQLIAYMGNSGSSTGPHLHFEIRNSMTEEALNPLQYGIRVPDHHAPQLFAVKLFEPDTYLPKTIQTLALQNKTAGLYTPSKDTIQVNSEYAGVAIRTYDQSLNSSSRLGVYGIRLYVDEQLHYQFDMNGVFFDAQRYSNAHRDYEEQVLRRQSYHRLFRLPGNKLPIYKQKINDGWIPLTPGQGRKVLIEVYDHSGNKSVVQFYLRGNAPASKPKIAASRPITFDQPFSEDREDLRLLFPSNSLYTDIDLELEKSERKESWSAVYRVHDSATPLHTSYVISLKPVAIPARLKNKSVVALFNGHSITNCGGTWNGAWLETRINAFGHFGVVVDTLPPVITPVVFKTDMKSSSLMKFRITDNFEVAGQADRLTYNAFIDDQWILMELDSKTDIITHRFDERTSKGTHRLRIQVKDDRGNERNFVQTFVK